MRSVFFIFVFLGMTAEIWGQDSITYLIEGIVLDLERKLPIEGAIITVYGDQGFSIESISNQYGKYSIKLSEIDPPKNYNIEVHALEYISEVHRLRIIEDSILSYDFNLRPSIICIDTWLPQRFTFKQHTTILHTEDSLALILRFSNPEIKKILQTYSYNIVTRRSTCEGDQIALERGNSLYLMLTQMGIDPKHITIENRSNSDFFYCMYGEGCVYEYQEGEGLNVTQKLIDKTRNVAMKEEYEAMRRIVQIEMKKRD